MHETDAELEQLQELLDASYQRAGEHLKGIFRPERRMSAHEIVRELCSWFVFQLGTVTAAHAPIVAPIDGLFYRGRFWIAVPPGAMRARHLRVRPQVSGVYSQGADVCIIVHGVAREVTPGDPEHAPFEAYCREVYGDAAFEYWANHYRERSEPGFTARIEPRRLYAMKAAAQSRPA